MRTTRSDHKRFTSPSHRNHLGLKVSSLFVGMVAGPDCIEDMAILRHCGMRNTFDTAQAQPRLGSLLRQSMFGLVRQLDAVACRVLAGLAASTPVLTGIGSEVLVDVDDTVIEVHGYAK